MALNLSAFNHKLCLVYFIIIHLSVSVLFEKLWVEEYKCNERHQKPGLYRSNPNGRLIFHLTLLSIIVYLLRCIHFTSKKDNVWCMYYGQFMVVHN